MATVSWGAPSLEFIKLEKPTDKPDTADWSTMSKYKKIEGSVLLQDSTTLNTTEGNTRELYNEFEELVDSKKSPSSYVLTTSVIKKKGESIVKEAFSPKNGIVDGNWAMRLTPEDPTTTGILMRKCTITTSKSWSTQQGGLDVINITGVLPDGENTEICDDYVKSVSP